MPKLNSLHILDRLQKRIEQLENGESLEARDINSLLTTVQQENLKAAWAEQQFIRKRFKTKSAAETAGLNWLTIRDVRLAICRQAVTDAIKNLSKDMADLINEKEKRAAKIFLAAYFAVDEDSVSKKMSAGNIALTRAGLRNPDNPVFLSARDREIHELEAKLKEKIKASMTPEELEEQQFLEECNIKTKKKRK